MTIPCHWRDGGLAGFAGRVRFRRRFGLPRTLDDFERVWLTFAGVAGSAELWLNGQWLGAPPDPARPFEVPVNGLLRPRNELTVEVEAADDGGGLWGEVALEIRRTAYLRNVRVALIGSDGGDRLEVTGELVGSAAGEVDGPGPLELYVLLDGRSVAYATPEPAPEGRPFRVVSGPLAAAGPGVARVELVKGASVWYTMEQTAERHPAAGR
jgi:hypothetical protein